MLKHFLKYMYTGYKSVIFLEFSFRWFSYFPFFSFSFLSLHL